MSNSFEFTPRHLARWCGVLYLAIILLGAFGEIAVRGSLVIVGDAAGTAANIAASQWLWRTGIAGDLLMHLCDLPVILLLYLLLRPVSQPLALLATLSNLIQTAVLVANKINLLFPLFLQQETVYLASFSAEQLHALAYLAIKAHGYGFGIGLIFFGFACLVRGFLIYQCGYLPKTLGLLLALAGLSYWANSFTMLLAPNFAAAISPAILAPALVGELSLSLWLIVKGIDLAQWEQHSKKFGSCQ